jgi:hypothetical protein
MSDHLTHHHRQTLSHLFDHQQAGNIHWREVESLLDHIGDVEHEHNGKVKVKLGERMLVVHPPKHGEIDRQTVVDLRHLLSEAGFAPEA